MKTNQIIKAIAEHQAALPHVEVLYSRSIHEKSSPDVKVISAVAGANKGLSVLEIAEITGLDPFTAKKAVIKVSGLGFLCVDPQGRYYPPMEESAEVSS